MKRENSATITAFGDILLHGRVYGGTKKTSNFKFNKQLSNVEDLLGKTDLTIGNLETVLAGKEYGLSSFPKFNGPAEIAYTLKDFGVDIVTIANNHVLDMGEKGLNKSIQNIKKAGLIYDGAYVSKEDSETLRVFDINGLRVCFISYTQSTNGIKLPENKPYLVNTFRNTSLLRLTRIMRKLKTDNIVDVLILNIHFGSEYHLEPSSRQREMSRSLADAGADVIIGHHPHVLQPPEWIETSKGTHTFVAYSLGNFFSGQDGLHRQIGAVLSFKVRKPDMKYKRIVVEDVKYDLTFVNREKRLRYDIYKLRDWIKNNKYIETMDNKYDANDIYEQVATRIMSSAKEVKVN